MANKKTSKRRRLKKKKQTVIPFEQRNFPKEIINRLEHIVSASGRRAGQVFEDFVMISEATLEALPEQIKAVGATGHFAEDTSEAAETFARVQSHYDRQWMGEDRAQHVWQNFAEAFALLLEATTPGLWGEPNSLNVAGISGPDILGYIFQTWANSASARNGLYMTPWPAATCMAQMLNLGLERMVYDRLKEALCHPDNVLGAAVLMASLAILDDEPGAHFEWFLNRCIPASAPYYQPLLVQEPAVGSGIMILAHAAASPAWAVQHNLIRYYGQDIDMTCVLMARASCKLYGLNGFALKLTAAAMEAVEAFQQRGADQPLGVPPSPAHIIQNVYPKGDTPPPANKGGGPSFEQMFRAVAMKQPAPVETVPA